MKLPITLILISYNEEIHLERCLSRAAPQELNEWPLDSFSAIHIAAVATR